MNFSNFDCLLIQSVYHSEKGEEGGALSNVIGYIDYLNHSIITYHELKESIASAKACGLIEVQGRKLKTTDSLKIWRNNLPKSLSITKESAELMKFLNLNYRDVKELVKISDFSEEEFNNAVEMYLKE